MGSKWRVWRWPLHWQIFLGLFVGAVDGLALGMSVVAQLAADVPADRRAATARELVRGAPWFELLTLLGDLFLRALFLIIIPLMTSSIVLAAARLGADRDFGRLGLKTVLYFGGTTLAATITGLLLVNLFAPGIGVDGQGILEGRDLSSFQGSQAEVTKRVGGRGLSDFLDIFRTMIPNNLVSAASEGNYLGLIVISLFTGILMTRLSAAHRETFERFVEAVYEMSFMATNLVLKLAPLGVLFLIAKTFAEQYATLRPDGRFTDFIGGIAAFAAVSYGAMALHLIVTMPLVLLLGRVNPWRHYKAMAPVLLTAFTTASSNGTLPVTIDCVETRAGVSPRITGFVIPLGATVNMNGTALYECVAAMFICQAFGVELTLLQQFVIVVLALLTSIGVAGVPAASLVAIAVILRTVESQLPPDQAVSLMAGMGILYAFDRPLDMARTALNVFGDTVAAVVIAKSEGETGVLEAR